MLKLTLPWPQSTNHFKHYGRGKCWLDPKTVTFRQDVFGIVAGRSLFDEGVVKPYIVIAKYYPPNRRSWDLDNRCKQLLDALVSAGACPDDRHIVELHLYKCSIDPKKKGYVDVIIKEA